MHAVSIRTGSCRSALGGFTLLELMVVVSVIGVLALVAMPSYQESVRKARRADARLILTDTAQRLERCYGECNSYVSGTCPAPCPTLPVTSTDGNYQITTGGGSAIAASAFSLVATPVAGAPQAADATCSSFTLTHLNVRTATGSNAPVCWK